MDNTMQLTFEAWLSTPANCARAAIMSYALDSHDPDPATRAAAYNHFVVFDTTNIIACHGAGGVDWGDVDRGVDRGVFVLCGPPFVFL